MRVFLRVRAVLVVLLSLWCVSYLPVYFLSAPLFAPLSACQIPLLPVFYGVNFGYVVYALLFLWALAAGLLSAFQRFSGKLFLVLVPVLFLLVDAVGQIICYRAASFEKYESGSLAAYYYFNGITPAPPWFFLASLGLDVLWILLYVLPLVLPYITRKKQAETPAEEEGVITTDNWSEIFAEEAKTQDRDTALHEDHKNSGEKS